jgi:hypothetical protein
MAYRGIQQPDDELQRRHDERNRMLNQTISIPEAVERYGVSTNALRKRLSHASAWYASPGAARYMIVDVEKAVEAIRAIRERQR